jgi:hypothetical protein
MLGAIYGNAMCTTTTPRRANDSTSEKHARTARLAAEAVVRPGDTPQPPTQDDDDDVRTEPFHPGLLSHHSRKRNEMPLRHCLTLR